MQKPGYEVTLIFCGDFNSSPDCGMYRLMTTNNVPPDVEDWRSSEYFIYKILRKDLIFWIYIYMFMFSIKQNLFDISTTTSVLWRKKKCNFFIETLTVLRLLEVIETFTKTRSFQIVWFFGSMDSLAFKFFGVHKRKSHKSYVKIYFILKYFCLKFQILMKLSMASPYHNHFPWRVLVAHQRPLTLLSGSQGVWITSTTREIILKLLRWASSTFPASYTEF